MIDRIKPLEKFEPHEDDDLIICRCEEITKGEIRKAVHDGMMTMNEIKRYLRAGMGMCQGLTCGRIVKDIIAQELKISPKELEDSNPRSPARAVSAKVFADNRE